MGLRYSEYAVARDLFLCGDTIVEEARSYRESDNQYRCNMTADHKGKLHMRIERGQIIAIWDNEEEATK